MASLFKLILALLVAAFGLAGDAAEAQAAKRVALVIGNQNYEHLTDLTKTLNDAQSMAKTLEEDLGFAVISGVDLQRREMLGKINELVNSVAKDDVVFFYYSGHGISLGAENYLLPVDLLKPREGEDQLVAADSYGVETVTRSILAKGAKAVFAVIDACRDNPLSISSGKSIGAGQGLAKIDAAEGVFVLFAAGLGQVALDRLSDGDADPNSVFTRKLIPLLKTRGLSQVDLAKRVQTEVNELAKTIGHAQKPAYYDEILGLVTLNEQGELTPTDTRPEPALSAAAQDWQTVKESGSKVVLEAFRDKYGDDPIYRGLADEKLAALHAPEAGSSIPAGAAEANLASAQAALTFAQTVFDQIKGLHEQYMASKAELDLAQSFVAEAQATVKAREAELTAAAVVDSAPKRIILDFDELDSRSNPAGAFGKVLYLYFAKFGIGYSFSNTALLSVIDDREIRQGQAVAAPSGHNFLMQDGADPASFTLKFFPPVKEMSFTRAALIAGPNGIGHPEWQAKAYTAAGEVIATASEQAISSQVNVAPRRFTLAADGIAAVVISGDNISGDMALSNAAIDDLELVR